jgi:hypothetical protein
MQNEILHEQKAGAAASAAPTSSPTPATRAGERDEIISSASSPAEINETLNFQIRCLSSALYHEDRERFFAWLHRWAMFLVVASGTAAFLPIKAEHPLLMPGIATFAGLIDLVFDVSGKARLHATLRKQIYAILADVGHVELKELERRLTLVYADEPPCMHAANAVAYNRAMVSYGRPADALLVTGWRGTIVRHCWPFTHQDFPTSAEAREAH